VAYLRQATWIEYGPGPVAQPRRPQQLPQTTIAPIKGWNFTRGKWRRRGVGADCGSSPCGWFDEVWVSDTCLAYLQQCSPNDPRVIAMQSGFVAGVTSAAANEAGAALSSVGSNAGSAVGTTLSALATSLFQNADGSTNWVTVGIAGALGLALVKGFSGGRR
jgi:hypothetical protein